MTSRLASTTLRIGDSAPPIALPGLDGELVELEEARGVCGVLLLFAPGAWSPATRRQLGEINAVYEQLRDNGVQVVVLITQNAGPLQDRLSSFAIPFPILADERRQAARDYGVFRALSLDGFGVTRPAAFIVDKDGIIRFAYVGKADDDVPEVDALLRLSIWLVGSTPIVEEDGEEIPSEEDAEATPAGEQLVLISDEVLDGQLADEVEAYEADENAEPVAPEMATAVIEPVVTESEPAATNGYATVDEAVGELPENGPLSNGHYNERRAANGEVEPSGGEHDDELTLVSSDRKSAERSES